MKSLVLMLMIASLAEASYAATSEPDGLLPELGAFGQYSKSDAYYYPVVAAALLPPGLRFTQMVVVPSREPERAVYTLISPTDCRVVASTLRNNIYHQIAKLRRTLPNKSPLPPPLSGLDLSVESRSAHLPQELCSRLREIWTSALSRVTAAKTIARSGEVTVNADSDGFHFAEWTEGTGYRTGWCWEPETDSRLGALRGIGENLFEIANASSEVLPSRIAALDRLVRSVIFQWNKER